MSNSDGEEARVVLERRNGRVRRCGQRDVLVIEYCRFGIGQFTFDELNELADGLFEVLAGVSVVHDHVSKGFHGTSVARPD